MSGAAVGDWFDHAPCGLVATSIDGAIVEANATFLSWTGYDFDELRGRPFASLLDPGSRLFFDTRHTQVLHLRGSVDEVALVLQKADGGRMPVLLNSVRDTSTQIDRIAVFNATERARHERDLLEAKRAAESSEERVRVLQDVSTTFGVTASDEEVAQSFAAVAGDAFAARETAVLLWQEDGELTLMGGTNPLAGKVSPVPSLRNTAEVTVVHAEDDQQDFPELAAAMRDSRLTSLSVTPLIADGQHLGVLVCFFARRADFDEHYLDLQQALGRQASQTLVRVRLQRRLAFLALHDQLTGVGNRQLLQSTIDAVIATSAAAAQPLSVLFLDIDDFKGINDGFGHAVGDLVLVELATRLRDSLRVADVVGRMGGDEFVAICPNTDIAAAEHVAERVLETCRAPIAVPDGIISASVSVGVTVYRPGTDPLPSAPQLLSRADAAMYDSKRSGKNRFTVTTR
ncbi:diguanylate cyclase [Microbacterium sp. Root180]|uniref:sensor domain-containing diguanylate cyclase n=1 Tax=Microbacterium sp. Root180 TaxID=1736483 RepID=UPI0007004045|nr:diguanylate cyclase [Microbacterium sp. Root180]KRB36604.1 PAS domain S-box protein [Microbacterium sp. Root180]